MCLVILAISRAKIISTVLFWAIPIMCTPRSNGVVVGRATQRDLWKPHRGKILGSQSPYPGVLVAQYAEVHPGLREEM